MIRALRSAMIAAAAGAFLVLPALALVNAVNAADPPGALMLALPLFVTCAAGALASSGRKADIITDDASRTQSGDSR